MVEFSSNDKKIYDYISSNETVTQSELPKALHIGKPAIRAFKEKHGDLIVESRGITVIDFFERNKKEKKNNERREFYKERFQKVIEFYELNLDSTYTDIAEATGESRKSVSEMFSLFSNYRLSNGRTLENQFNQSNVEREALCNKIFEIFNSNPNLGFSEIENILQLDIPRGKVRKLLIEMGDRLLSNGNTVSIQLEINKNSKKEELEQKENEVISLFITNPNYTPTIISNLTGVDRATVVHYLDKNGNLKLENGLTITEQRNSNREDFYSNIEENKNTVLNYFISNPSSSYNEISISTGIDVTTVRRYLQEYSEYIIPELNITVSEQININQTKYRELEIKIFNYFKENPTVQFKDIARLFECSPTSVSRFIHAQDDYVLPNGLTVKEQVMINQNYVDEDAIVKEFIKDSSLSLHQLAYICDVDVDSVRRHLYKHVDKKLSNGLTIGEQLNKNNTEIWHRQDDITPRYGVFIRSNGEEYQELIAKVDGMRFELRDNDDKKIGTIDVSGTFEEKVIKEAIYYVIHDLSIKEASKELHVSDKTLISHLKKLETINKNLFRLVEKKKEDNRRRGILNRKPSSGRPTFYSDELIEELANRMILNQFTYLEASEEFGIPKSTLYELMQRVSPELRSQLDLLAYANAKNKTVREIVEGRKY